MPLRSLFGKRTVIAWSPAILFTPLTGLILMHSLNLQEPATHHVELALHAMSLLVAGQLLLVVPAAESEFSPASLLVALYLGVTSLVLLWPASPDPALTLRISLAATILALFFTGCTRLLGTLLGDTQTAGAMVLIAAITAGAAPVWAGPLLEFPGIGAGLADLLLAVSPFTFLATMADWDFLRHNWFYRHSPIGGLRFHYPDTITSGTVYLLIALFCHAATHLIRRRRSVPPPTELSPNQTIGANCK